MTITERLPQYYEFDEDIVETLASVAEEQNKKTFKELATEFGVQDGPNFTHPFADKRTVEYLALIPKGDYDECSVRVLYNPVAIPADESTAMRAIRLFAADPSVPMLVIGNPAYAGRNTGAISLKESTKVFRGNLSVAVRGSLAILRNRRHAHADVLGYSYGADLAAQTAADAPDAGMAVRAAILAEPAMGAKPGTMRLLQRFASSGKELEGYVEAAASPPLTQAREMSDHGFARYAAGLLRLSNIAIANALAKNEFGSRVDLALTRNPAMRAVIAWGGASEVTDNAVMERETNELSQKYDSRVGRMVLRGMHHAGGDDIDLHAAIMLQGLRGAKAV